MTLVAPGCESGWNRVRVDAERVAVIAAGACTPLGASIEASWHALRAGRSGVSNVEHLTPAPSRCQVAAVVSAAITAPPMRVAKHMKYAGRSTVTAIHALHDALGGRTLRELVACEPDRIALHTATGQTGLDEEEFYPALSAAWAESGDCDYARLGGRAARLVDPHFSLRTLSNGPLALIAAETEVRGPSCNYVQGELAGALALRAALHDLREHRADAALVVACDSLVHPGCWLTYESAGLLSKRGPEVAPAPFDSLRDGLVLGEGAGVVVLQRVADARLRAVPVVAEIDSVHLAQAPGPSPDSCTRSIAAALGRAAGRAGAWPHVLVARGLGTERHDAEEAEALNELSPAAPVVTTALKGATGYLGAATALVELIVGMRMLDAGVVPAVTHLTRVDRRVRFPIARMDVPLDRTVRRVLLLSGDWHGETACIDVTTGSEASPSISGAEG